MNITILFVSILIYIYYAKVANGVNSSSKWFLFHNNLFYVEFGQIFTSHQAQQFCITMDMVYIIEESEYIELSKLVLGNSENTSTLWLLDEKFLLNSATNTSYSECYTLSTERIRTAQCASLNGVICKTKIDGASLQFKNGTAYEIGVNDTSRICDPQSNQYDEQLEYCLIQFSKLLL